MEVVLGIAIMVTIIVVTVVLTPHIPIWVQKLMDWFHNWQSSKEIEKEEQTASVQQTPQPSSSMKTPKYLGNSNTKEIHDLSNIKKACQINKIKPEHEVNFYTFEEAQNAIENNDYDGCKWCFKQYHTD